MPTKKNVCISIEHTQHVEIVKLAIAAGLSIGEYCRRKIFSEPIPKTDKAGDVRQAFQFVVAVDFDGVIHRYSKGWYDGTIYDRPTHDCATYLEHMRELGAKIVIFTTRAVDRVVNGKVQPSQAGQIQTWCHKYDIPYDEIYTAPGKPIAHIYLDDRAVRFNGSWVDAFAEFRSQLMEWQKEYGNARTEGPKRNPRALTVSDKRSR